MKTEVSILHHEYPPAARDFVVEKLQHLTRYFDRTHSVRAVLERQHDEHRVELVARVRRGQVLVVDARADSLSRAIDTSVERMGRALVKHKDKLTRQQRRSRVSSVLGEG